jgi:hypothetical protein
MKCPPTGVTVPLEYRVGAVLASSSSLDEVNSDEFSSSDDII